MVVVVMMVLVLFMAIWLVALDSSGGGGIIPTSHTVNIVNGLVTVNVDGYESYQFTVPSGASNIQVSGTFTASGSSGNDMRVYIMDSTGYVNRQNEHTVNTYYSSGQLTTGTISCTLPTGGTYSSIR